MQTGPDRRTEEGARSWLSLKAVGGRSKETGDELGAEVKSRGKKGELRSGAGTRRRAQGRTRGLSGDHRRRKGRSGSHSQEEFAGVSAVPSAHERDGASAIPLSPTELRAEIAPVAPVSIREQQQLSCSRATTAFPTPSNNNLPHPGHQQFPAVRAERAPVTPSVPHPNRGADHETRACAEIAGESSPATPGARSQARYADIVACPPSRHEGAGKTLRSRGPGRSSRSHAHLVHGPVCHPCL